MTDQTVLGVLGASLVFTALFAITGGAFWVVLVIGILLLLMACF